MAQRADITRFTLLHHHFMAQRAVYTDLLTNLITLSRQRKMYFTFSNTKRHKSTGNVNKNHQITFKLHHIVAVICFDSLHHRVNILCIM